MSSSQLRVFYTYVRARKSLNHFNITFEVNKCFDEMNSAFPTVVFRHTPVQDGHAPLDDGPIGNVVIGKID